MAVQLHHDTSIIGMLFVGFFWCVGKLFVLLARLIIVVIAALIFVVLATKNFIQGKRVKQ